MATRRELEATIETVKAVQARRAQDGQRYWLVTAGGQRYYCWDAELAEGLKPGATYELSYRPGRFPRLKAARPVASANGAQGEALAGQEPGAAERLEALRLAMAAIGQVRPQDVPQVIEAARLILDYLRGERG